MKFKSSGFLAEGLQPSPSRGSRPNGLASGGQLAELTTRSASDWLVIAFDDFHIISDQKSDFHGLIII